MRSRLVRTLVFACSLLLAFPPAWCCMALDLLPVPRANADDADQPAPPESTCCCCKAKQPAPPPDAASEPAPPREAPPPCQSGKCCWDRHTTPPQHPQQFHPDHTIVAVLPPTVAAPVVVSEATAITLRALPVSPPIHVFDCVWLC